MIITCGDDDVLGPGCPSYGVPHDPVFLKHTRSQRTGRFLGSIWVCDRCGHRVPNPREKAI